MNSTHTRKTSGLGVGSGSGLDLSALRAKLDGQTGPRFWRGLEQIAETEDFRQFLHREFPEQASEWTDPTSRRNFLRLMGASLALAGIGLSGCDYATEPAEKILPYVRQPENLVQGVPQKYATAVTLGGYATGVVAESHMGRPTMLEGNGKHPDSLGAIDPRTQGTLLTLYDPDRSQVIMRGKLISTFDAFLLAAVSALDARRDKKGNGVRLLTETVTSPSLARQLAAFKAEFPEAVWHQYEPTGPHASRAGAKQAFGRDVVPRYKLDEADVVLALDADFLATGPGHLRLAREFAARREPGGGGAGATAMNRLYAVEPSYTVTGSMADHRLRLRAREVAAFAMTLARRLGVAGVPEPPAVPAVTAAGNWVDAVAKDLQAHKGAALVIPGDGQPSYVHALAHAINKAIGAPGKTVLYTEPVEAEPVDQVASITELCRAMKAGEVEALFILGGNPSYTAPADLGFSEGLKKVKFKARLGLYEDETSDLCDWHVPETHELETWGDARGSDGTATVQQPLIAPLFGGRSAIELVAALLRHPDRTGYEIVRATWRERAPKGQGESFETFWRTSVHEGVVAGTAAKVVEVEPKADLGAPPSAPADASKGALEVVFRPDPNVWDGRFANNGWLQELPRPITKLTWDNAAILSPATAQRLGVSERETSGEHDVVVLTLGGRTVEAPVVVLPGHADGSVTLHLGYGRSKTGRVGTGAGFNAYLLRTSDALAFTTGLDIRPAGRAVKLTSTQMHGSLEGRDMLRVGTLKQYESDKEFAHKLAHAHPPDENTTLYPPEPPDYVPGANDYQWAMVVNLNACTGCNACTIACVAENNIPVVGRDQVSRGREMHWLEVDRYFAGGLDDPSVYHQPRLCMHCEKAPCEVVCPVAATLHDTEGLNVMVYNRCVGTRYCSNNCPYKVRKFNFLQYADFPSSDPKREVKALVNNPDVTVRARGVMEKCTYCVQRINQARYASELKGERIKDGDVVTACQAACPTRAITFGDKSDPNSAVSKLRNDPRDYAMLAELNTRPRTTYLAKLRNPNPELETEPPPPIAAEKTEPSHGV